MGKVIYPLVITDENLMKEWDYKENNKNNLFPDKLTLGSGKKVSWICKDCGHIWQSTIANRRIGNGCPKCALIKIGKKNSRAKNGTLAEKRPDLLKDWDYNKNNELGLNPETVAVGSQKYAFWKCNMCGHTWKTAISHRTGSKGTGCSQCYKNGPQLRLGKSIKSEYPDIVKEWDYENNILTPDKVAPTSQLKIHWICKRGHSYVMSPVRRIKNTECPKCAKNHRISVKEQIVYFFIKKYFPDAICSYTDTWLGRKELDIYIPSLKTGIEYDGERYHQDLQETLDKDKICTDNRINIIHIRELKCPKSNQFKNAIELKGYSDSDLEDGIEKTLMFLGITNPIIDIKKESTAIYQEIDKLKVSNSLSCINPQLTKEWNYSLNGRLTPKDVGANSKLKVWWTSKTCGHTWNASISNRNKGQGCPYCRGLAVLRGFNDAKSKIPNIERYWNWDKNIGSPEDYYYGTHKKFYIRCPDCGKEDYISMSNIYMKIKRNQLTLCRKCNNTHSINPNKRRTK